MKNISEITMREGKVICEDSSGLPCESIRKGYFLDRALYCVQMVVGYIFGIHVGYVFGGLLGLYIGSVYVEYSEPARFSSWNGLRQWAFARTGAAVGVLVGVLAIRIVDSIFLSRDIASLYGKGATEPKKIANVLGRSVRQTKRRMNRLARKGVIAFQVTDSSVKSSLWAPDEEDSSGHLAAPTPVLKRA